MGDFDEEATGIDFFKNSLNFRNQKCTDIQNELKWMKKGLLGVSGPSSGSKLRFESIGTPPGPQNGPKKMKNVKHVENPGNPGFPDVPDRIPIYKLPINRPWQLS